jgi:hypothetical protein
MERSYYRFSCHYPSYHVAKHARTENFEQQEMYKCYFGAFTSDLPVVDDVAVHMNLASMHECPAVDPSASI